MTFKKLYFLILIPAFTMTACGQAKNDRIVLGKSYAENELRSVLTGEKKHNAIDGKTSIIKDSATAISVVEPVLFNIYGKENITKQQPYEVYFLDNYWVIGGTLPKGYLGGTFLIILDSRDCKILRITHGK